MSIIRATRQKGGEYFPFDLTRFSVFHPFFLWYSSSHKATSYGRVTDELLSNQKESRRNNNSYHGKIKNIRKDFQPYGQVFACRFFYAP